MKVLVAFYSMTGNTEKLARAIAGQLGADIEHIELTKRRSGPLGIARGMLDTFLQRKPAIKPRTLDPSAYEFVIIGTPVWAGSLSGPVRSYLEANARAFNGKVAFFYARGGSGADAEMKAFGQMQELAGKPPVATMGAKQAEIKSGEYERKVTEFVKAVSKA